jgi:hypothetical protein
MMAEIDDLAGSFGFEHAGQLVEQQRRRRSNIAGCGMRRFAIGLFIGSVLMALAAVPAGAGAANVKKFCNASLAVDVALNAAQPKPRVINGLLNAVARTAPPEIADAVSVAVPAFKANPETAFEDPEVEEAVGQIEAFEYESCGHQQVDVALEDYAFDGIPSDVERGTTAFGLTNNGAEAHEMFVVRLKPGTAIDELLAADEAEFEELAEAVGGGFALPGESGYATMSMKKPGRYAAICLIPVGTTETVEGTGPPHAAEGMVTEFRVT